MNRKPLVWRCSASHWNSDARAIAPDRWQDLTLWRQPCPWPWPRSFCPAISATSAVQYLTQHVQKSLLLIIAQVFVYPVFPLFPRRV